MNNKMHLFCILRDGTQAANNARGEGKISVHKEKAKGEQENVPKKKYKTNTSSQPARTMRIYRKATQIVAKSEDATENNSKTGMERKKIVRFKENHE